MRGRVTTGRTVRVASDTLRSSERMCHSLSLLFGRFIDARALITHVRLLAPTCKARQGRSTL